MQLELLEALVLDWAEEKQILAKATPYKQAQKTLEECGELLHAIGANDKAEIKDAIGDVFVTLIIQAEMQGLKIGNCLEAAYEVIKNRKGSMQNGQFIKETL